MSPAAAAIASLDVRSGNQSDALQMADKATKKARSPAPTGSAKNFPTESNCLKLFVSTGGART